MKNKRAMQSQFKFAAGPRSSGGNGCDVVPVGKRRDGGTRYWCLMHKADATAKYGKPAKKCRYADVPMITDGETLRLDADRYPGGVACWGAVPPVYDTTTLPLDRGIHVHARAESKGEKKIDQTYRRVRLVGKSFPDDGCEVSELDAIYYMVTAVFGFEMRHVVCSECGYPHLDKDWFSVHAHRRHLCSGCGKHFRYTATAIGNPIAGLRSAVGSDRAHRLKKAGRKLSVEQSQYKGGLQIWGSNPAILWTSDEFEEEGIHVHAFEADGDTRPRIDDTFSEVVVDGVKLDPVMVRVLMAQSALPHVLGRVTSQDCPGCGATFFSKGEAAFTPATTHECNRCREEFGSQGRLRKVILNPLVRVFDHLARGSGRQRQKHDLGLIPETI